jgi:hypothetical protein
MTEKRLSREELDELEQYARDHLGSWSAPEVNENELLAVVAMAKQTIELEAKNAGLRDHIRELHAGFVALREDSDPCGETFMFSEAANALFDRITQFSPTDTEKG